MGMLDAVDVADARKVFKELVDRAEYKGDRIVLRRKGKGAAAIVSIEDLRMLRRMEEFMDEKSREGLRNGEFGGAKVAHVNGRR